MQDCCNGEFPARRCSVCIAGSVARICAETGIRLTDEERRQLIGGLLARQHLILSGPQGSRKCELARALAYSLVEERRDRVCTLLGHPWWAGNTGDVAYYANMQMAYSEWRLVYFLAEALGDQEEARPPKTGEAGGRYVVCLERMSAAEVDLYFGTLAYGLLSNRQGLQLARSLHFIGTYDSDTPPALDARTLRVAALVHVDAASDR